MPKPRKPSRFLPAPVSVEWIPEVQNEIDSGLETILRDSAKSARSWLVKRGWVLKGEICEGWKPCFARKVGGRLEILKGASDTTDPRDAVSYYIVTHAEFARLASKRGDHAKAMGWAYWAGWYCGKSNALLAESKHAGKSRAGSSNVPRESYLRAIEEAGPGATVKEIVAELSGGSAGISAHYKQIRKLRREVDSRRLSK